MASFSNLPPSVLQQIRDSIPKRDVFTHIAFQATSRAVRNVYTVRTADTTFWRAVCIAGGAALPATDVEFPFNGASWRDLAIICANHFYMCTLDMCVPCNPTAEAHDAAQNKALDVEDARELDTIDGFDTELNVLTGICGAPSTTHAVDALGDRRILHAAGLCKFATVPPVQGLWVHVFSERRWVYNDNGVTQWDVVRAVRDKLRNKNKTGSVLMSDIFVLCEAAQNDPAVFATARRYLRWLMDAMVRDMIGPFERVVRRRTLCKQNIHENALAAAKDLAMYARKCDPNARLVDLWAADAFGIQGILSQVYVSDFHEMIAWLAPEYSTAPWALGIIDYEMPLSWVNNHFMFRGIRFVDEPLEEKDTPAFECLWAPMTVAAPMEKTKIFRIRTHA